MTWLRGTCILVLCIGYVIGQDFDCRRSTQVCANGECTDANNGTCTCPQSGGNDQFIAKDCSVEVVKIPADQSSCNPPCLNGATCYEPTAGSFECRCMESYFGAQCEKNRINTNCSGDTMSLDIEPIAGFTGKIYASNISSTLTPAEKLACEFNESVTDRYRFSADQLFAGNCGVQEINDSPNPGDVTYTNQIVIQFSSTIESQLDIILTSKCIQIGSGISNLQDNVASIAVDQRADLQKVESSKTYQPVSLHMQTPAGGTLPAKVFIGDLFRIHIPLSDTGRYSALKILNLNANNGLTGSALVTAPLITAGCLTADGKSVISNDTVEFDPSIPSLNVNMFAFRFSGAEDINFDVEVKVCDSTDLSTCADSNCAVSRRKRDATQGLADNEVVLHGSLTVLDSVSGATADQVVPQVPADKPATPKTDNFFNSEKCLQSKEILTMVIVLVAAVILLLVITMCLAVRFMKSRSQSKIMPTSENMVKIPRPTF